MEGRRFLAGMALAGLPLYAGLTGCGDGNAPERPPVVQPEQTATAPVKHETPTPGELALQQEISDTIKNYGGAVVVKFRNLKPTTQLAIGLVRTDLSEKERGDYDSALYTDIDYSYNDNAIVLPVTSCFGRYRMDVSVNGDEFENIKVKDPVSGIASTEFHLSMPDCSMEVPLQLVPSPVLHVS